MQFSASNLKWRWKICVPLEKSNPFLSLMFILQTDLTENGVNITLIPLFLLDK